MLYMVTWIPSIYPNVSIYTIHGSYGYSIYIYISLYLSIYVCVRPMYNWSFRFRNWLSGAIPEPF